MNKKSTIAMYVALLFIAVSASRIFTISAQTFGVQPSGVTLAQCQVSQPPAVNSLWFCNIANDAANPAGMYVSANGAPYFLVAKAGGGGAVATVFGRTGNVTAAQGDYSFAQLSGALLPTQIPTHTCTMTTVTGTNAAVVTLSGCK